MIVVYPFLLHRAVRHGGGVRLLRLLQELARRRHAIKLLCLSEVDAAPYSEEVTALGSWCSEVRVIERPRLTWALKAWRFLKPGLPAHARNLLQPEAQRYVREVSGEWADVVYLVSTAAGAYMGSIDRRRCGVIVDAEDLETRRYAKLLATERRPLRWLHSLITWWRERCYEADLFSRADHVVAITPEEQVAVSGLCPNVPVTVVPPFVDTGQWMPLAADRVPEKGACLYLGAFTHPPNAEAVRWFCREVLPHVKLEMPEAFLYVVGWRAREVLGNLASPDVRIVGTVDDLFAWFSRASVMVAPVLSGGGARIKVVEGLAAGLPVVTTSLGSEGIAEPPGEAYLVADTGADFVREVVSVLSSSRRQQEMGRAARSLVERRHNAGVAGDLFERVLQLVRHGAS